MPWHARARHWVREQWNTVRGRRGAWIALAAYSTFIINYFGVNFFLQGLHSYSGVS